MALPIVPYSGPIVTRAEAKTKGLKRYFMGPDKPCKYGHISERITVDGGCILCARTAAMSAEQLESKRRYALKYDEAHRAEKNLKTAARYREKKATDPDALRAKWRDYKAANKEKSAAWTKRWYLNNWETQKAKRDAERDVRAERGKAWAQANPEKVAAKTRRWQAKNPDAWREYRKNNPEATRAIKQARRARERGAEGRHTRDELKALFAQQGGKCVYCEIVLTKSYCADHIVPLSRGGSNWIANIQLLCRSCNSRKWAIDPAEFARRRKASR